MSVSTYQVISPGRKRGKRAIIKTALFILGRSMQSASRFDKKIQQELESWPENFTIVYKAFPKGPMMTLCKNNNKLKRCKPGEEDPDMIIYLKNLEYAFLLMTSRRSSVEAFLEHGAFLKGDLSIALSLIRILNRV
ncbi:hypothetical protein CEE45_01755 [Candidatus Heimdallarchaeota archaeon B3_Heim]|nr:MAG: hypothetical protein CEE45_01755 [Candidatus Heimdallarchaeota archaeon B3_Heim]